MWWIYCITEVGFIPSEVNILSKGELYILNACINDSEARAYVS